MNDTEVKVKRPPTTALLSHLLFPIQCCSQPTQISLSWCVYCLSIAAIPPPARIGAMTKANHNVTILERGSWMQAATSTSISCQVEAQLWVTGLSTKTHLVTSWHRGSDGFCELFIKFYHSSSFSLPTSSFLHLEFSQMNWAFSSIHSTSKSSVYYRIYSPK